MPVSQELPSHLALIGILIGGLSTKVKDQLDMEFEQPFHPWGGPSKTGLKCTGEEVGILTACAVPHVWMNKRDLSPGAVSPVSITIT